MLGRAIRYRGARSWATTEDGGRTEVPCEGSKFCSGGEMRDEESEKELCEERM